MPRYWETWEQRQKENTFRISFRIGLTPLKRLFQKIFLRKKTENMKNLKEKGKELKKVMGKTFSGEEEQHERH